MKKLILLPLIIGFLFVGCKGQSKKVSSEADMTVKADTVMKEDMNKPITVFFMGTEKNGKEQGLIQVIFYPAEEKAVVTQGANSYELAQYVTGSGYGYKNEIVDLRGKGSEATMTFSDKSRPEIYLKEKK